MSLLWNFNVIVNGEQICDVCLKLEYSKVCVVVKFANTTYIPRTNLYDRKSRSNASAHVSGAVGVTLKRNVFQIVRSMSFSSMLRVRLDKRCGWRCIPFKMDDSFFRRVEQYHTRSCYAGFEARK